MTKGETEGFILRAAHTNTRTDRTVIELQPPHGLGSALRNSFARPYLNPPPVWSDLRSICLVNLRDPFGTQQAVRLGEDLSKASVCCVQVNEHELTKVELKAPISLLI